MMVTKKQLEELAISPAEYGEITERLGREPNDVELGLFGSLWSEHCGYKHSKPLLRTLPSDSPRLLVEPGVENAGAIDLGDGIAVVFKVESHNHPSAIEPYEGAATGVGGIVRDILAMGARPIALLNSLRFGSLDDPENRRLFEGVVAGISGYGNCIGVPDVGGEVFFSDAYAANPLVNAMCIGVLDPDKMSSAMAGDPGNVLLLVGADTGRDGIHGASGLASQTFEEGREELRPTVQVGNPFLEKVLIEACLELVEVGEFVGLQDLGAAGLTSAAVEAADKNGRGLDLDVGVVPRRDSNMTPYEIMLSESQERMLVIAKPAQVEGVRRIFSKWDLDVTEIGTVTADATVKVRDGDRQETDLPIGLLTDPPLYRLSGVKPQWLDDLQARDLSALPLPSQGIGPVLLDLLASPNIASKRWVYRQYDHHVQINTVVEPGAGDAAVLRLPDTTRGLATAIDGNGRLGYLNPYVGGVIAVAEACRNVACVGGEPIALTDCLNFGNPEKPEVYYQLEESVKGIADAARAFNVPVVSGNVSLYNESGGNAIYPTPVIGALGVLEDVSKRTGMAFVEPGDTVVLLGTGALSGDPTSMAGSEYLDLIHSEVAGNPGIDLELEVAVQQACRRLVREGIARSAHDVSEGGLAVALAESCILGGVGFELAADIPDRWDAALFGEPQSLIVVSVAPDAVSRVAEVARDESVPFVELGTVGGNAIKLGNSASISVKELSDAWYGGIESRLARGL
jgi:phosphoribosylformylglycinamidine synthase